MASINLKSLVERLDTTCRTTLESAAGLCLSRTHYNVEIEHWLVKILENVGSDVDRIIQYFEMDGAKLQADLNKALDRNKTGNSRPPALSPQVVDLGRDAWLIASLEFGAGSVRSGHLIAAMLGDETLSRQAREVSAEFEKINRDTLLKNFARITAESIEDSQASARPAPGDGGAVPRPGGGQTPNLDAYTIDLTERAAAGEIDPVLGRESEVRQVIDILTRRRQNNPILTGEPGVGKTAAAEGFALQVAAGQVPDALKGVAVKTLDLSLLQAGAGMKGEFENRLKGVIEEVKASPQPIILFIDEAHTMIGAGGAAGQGDAANLLKPALARGELRTIAATTWAEYKKYFERDAALARRFQVVKIEEPEEDVAIQIMQGLVAVMERHHGVRVMDDAIRDSVRLSMRYITGRQLPDKSVSLLDTACARVRLSQAARPSALEDCDRRLGQIDTELGILEREALTTDGHDERMAALRAERVEVEAQEQVLGKRWDEEMALIKAIDELRGKLEGPDDDAAEPVSDEQRADLKADLTAKRAELEALQGDAPLVLGTVDSQAIAEVVSTWTGIPVGRMVSDQIRSILDLQDLMGQRVVGQDYALKTIAQAISTSRANLTDPSKPIGVFMLAGTSGVGKTETAISLAEVLYGGEQNMTVINMSEFKEEHKVSLLVGSPPGYVGFGEGGVLTEAVRRKPYSVVLLDELEKAHQGVQELFYQVFDKGTLKDGEGRDIDFKNTVILMTTNAGTETITSLWADPETCPDSPGLVEAMKPELLQHFKPAFLGRTQVLPYLPLSDDVMRKIIRLKLGKIVRRVEDNYGATLTYDDAVVETIAGRCTEVETGARNVDHILTRTLLPELSREFLSRMSDGGTIREAAVEIDSDGRFAYRIF